MPELIVVGSDVFVEVVIITVAVLDPLAFVAVIV